MGFALSILFVIFGGGYYLVRYLIDSGQSAGFKANYERSKRNRYEFEKLVFNEEVEKKINDWYSKRQYAAVEAQAYGFAKDEPWFDKINLMDSCRMIYRAGNGCLGTFDTSPLGICADHIKLNKGVYGEEGGIARGQMMLWVVEQLKKHGVDTKLIVRSFDDRYRYLTENNVYDEDDRYYIFEQVFDRYTGTIRDTYPPRERRY